MKRIQLAIPYRAIGEARPRVVRSRTKTYAYVPKKKHRAEFRQLLFDAYKRPPLTGPITVSFMCLHTMPTSWSGKKKALMIGQGKTTKPDIDNILKFLLDAGNGILWEDDRQIWDVSASKIYGLYDEIQITITLPPDHSCQGCFMNEAKELMTDEDQKE